MRLAELLCDTRHRGRRSEWIIAIFYSSRPFTLYSYAVTCLLVNYKLLIFLTLSQELLDDYGIYEYPDWFVELAAEYNTPQDFIKKKDSQKPGFHIKYELKTSNIGGVGLFVTENVKKHSLIWKYCAHCNIKVFYTEKSVREHLNSLQTSEAKYEWISHVYSSDGYLNEITDDGKYWNHSEDPNTVSGVNGDWDSTFAKRDILAGEVRIQIHILHTVKYLQM